LGREGADGGHGREVELHDVELCLRRLGEDGVLDGLGGGEAPDGHDDVGPAQRQRPRRLGADAAGCPWMGLGWVGLLVKVIRGVLGWDLLLEKEEELVGGRNKYGPVTMAVRPAAEMPCVTWSAVELQEKPEGPRRPRSHEVIIFALSLSSLRKWQLARFKSLPG